MIFLFILFKTLLSNSNILIFLNKKFANFFYKEIKIVFLFALLWSQTNDDLEERVCNCLLNRVLMQINFLRR